MTSLRTIELRAFGFSVTFALVAGCVSSVPLTESGDSSPANDGGADSVSTGDHAHANDGGAAPDAAAHRIEAFTFAAADNKGLAADVDGAIKGKTIAVTLPAEADVTALVPTIDFDGKKVAPASAKAEDFSKPVSYVVTADDGSKATYAVTVTVTGAPPAMCVGTAASCSADVYNRAVAFANANPTRPVSHGTWNQYCAALMYWFGGFSASAGSAADAYHASPISSTDPTTAPIGAFHYWSLPGSTAGHVGVDLLGEGAVVFMASEHVAEHFGTSGYVGVNNVASYNESSGATYLGWSIQFNGHNQTISGGGACGAASVPSGCTVPASTTETTGAPDAAFVMRLQEFGKAHGYAGAIDGQSNAATWAAVQSGLQAYGYTGPVNGLPGKNTYIAFQTLAHDKGGYSGPIDGLLGPNSFKGLATYLNDNF